MNPHRDVRPTTTPRVIGRLALCVIIVYGLPIIFLSILNFPRTVDDVPVVQRIAEDTKIGQAQSYYDNDYSPGLDDIYVRTARRAAQIFHVEDKVRTFVKDFHLQEKRVLEVGAGSGLLQDVVDDYTALDVAPSARRFFHKPFIQASATAMPFDDETFDVVWTVWVLEHVSQPEQALSEIRRVTKNGGLLYLAPAWNCTSWAADGYEARPYSDFGLVGKLTKASIPVRMHPLYRMSYLLPIRFVRMLWLFVNRAPTALRYTKLNANFRTYWVPDSDAVNSLDSYEAYLWFISRGDQCLDCATTAREATEYERWPLIIRVRK